MSTYKDHANYVIDLASDLVIKIEKHKKLSKYNNVEYVEVKKLNTLIKELKKELTFFGKQL